MTPVFLYRTTARLRWLFSERSEFGMEGNQEFGFRHVQLQMPSKHPSGYVKMVVRYLNLEVRIIVTVLIELGIAIVLILFKAM